MLVDRDLNNFYDLKWLDTYMMGHKGFIAGGCFKNIFNKEKVKDIDVFFESDKDFQEARLYYEGKDEEYYKFYENSNVIAFKNRSEYKNNITIELIRTTFGTPEEILNSFDFTIVKFAYYKKLINIGEDDLIGDVEYRILHDENFFEHIQRKRLVVDDKMLFPVSTFERMLRYAKYGYFPCRETKIKLIEEIRNAEVLDGIGASLYHGFD